MTRLPKTFNGREFQFYFAYNSESDVKDAARAFKAHGYYTRIVDTGRTYELWTREKGNKQRQRR